MRTLLTIAGFDPSSGAGVTADLMVFAAYGFFGTSCITGLTVQSTLGVRAVYPVEARTLGETLSCLDEDLPPAGIKIGMLATAKAVEAVVAFLEFVREKEARTDHARIPIVVDPVIRSSSGRELLDAPGLGLLRARLLPLAAWVTPNRNELAVLTNARVASREEMVSQATALQDDFGRDLNVLVTGGDLDPPDEFLLEPDGSQHWIEGTRVDTTSTHGTGCALSSALLCRLVLGDDAVTAARNAKAYVEEALRRASPIGHGRGPMNLLWPLLKT